MPRLENSGSRVDAVHQAALEAYEAGLCILPPAEDGSKRPLPNPSGTWDPYKLRRPTLDELRGWYPGHSGIGVVTGAVSGDVECWDFDDRPTYEAFVEIGKASGLGDVITRIENGYCDDTGGGGVRWLVRYPSEIKREPGKRETLARRPKRLEERRHDRDSVKVLIEMPAYSIVAPTNGRVHPTGKAYERRSGLFPTIASYTTEERDALTELARSFDLMPRDVWEPRAQKPSDGKDRPGDEFNATTTWEELLVPRGWKLVFTRNGVTHWRRPGKKVGTSATTNYGGSDLFYPFSTSTEFNAGESYSRFAFYAVIEHRGDFKAAARALADQGYGNKSAPTLEAAEPDVLQQVGDYRETSQGIQWLKRGRDSDNWLPLTNFGATIIANVTVDDGFEPTRSFEIKATLKGRVGTFTVNASQFNQMNWVLENLGAEAVVQPGQGAKDRTRAAIQSLSKDIPDKRIYTHTGWRKVGEEWVYLHAGGALGATGPVEGLDVRLPEPLRHYELKVDENPCEAVQATLAIRRVAPDKIIVPLIACIARAIIGKTAFSLLLEGFTGVHKTGLAALAQQHFGSTMDEGSLPGSWTSTANSLEMMASAARDAVLVVDDYVPPGSMAERSQLKAKAERLLRAQGNNTGRGRLRPDGSMRPSRPPAGLIVSTGEEVPGGQSLRARTVVCEVERGDVKLDELTIAQKNGASGLYAQSTAAFIRWLAPQLESIRGELKSLSHQRRLEVGVGHDRVADNLAQISATWIIYLRFAVEIGAITRADADRIEIEVTSTLKELAADQQTLQRANDPVDRFLTLLSSALSTGRVHIACADRPSQKPGIGNPELLGWKKTAYDWEPSGRCVGWVAQEGVYLDPEAAYDAAQHQAGPYGETITIESGTLQKRLHQRGLLLSVERRDDGRRLRVRKTVGGRRLWVWHLPHKVLAPLVQETAPTAPTAPEKENCQKNQGGG